MFKKTLIEKKDEWSIIRINYQGRDGFNRHGCHYCAYFRLNEVTGILAKKLYENDCCCLSIGSNPITLVEYVENDICDNEGNVYLEGGFYYIGIDTAHSSMSETNRNSIFIQKQVRQILRDLRNGWTPINCF